jgi:hypothetical protein
MNDRDELDTRVLRRINDNKLEEFMSDMLNEDDFNPCSWDDAGEYISDLCDYLKDYFLRTIRIDTNPKTKDALYYYLVDKFRKLLLRIYIGRICY